MAKLLDQLQAAAALRSELFVAHGVDLVTVQSAYAEREALLGRTAVLTSAEIAQYRVLDRQLIAYEVLVRSALHDLFSGQRGRVYAVGVNHLTAKQQEQVRMALQFVEEMTPAQLSVRFDVSMISRRESYAPDTNTVYLSPLGSPAHVIVHELGHAIEDQHADSGKISFRQAYFQHRTDGHAAQALAVVTGNPAYHPSEQTRVDTWLNPYIGKVYMDAKISEVISMGLQMLYKEPLTLLQDVEYLDFLYAFLRG